MSLYRRITAYPGQYVAVLAGVFGLPTQQRAFDRYGPTAMLWYHKGHAADSRYYKGHTFRHGVFWANFLHRKVQELR